MTDPAWVALAVLGTAVAIALAVGLLGWQRRRALTGRVASFSCSLRTGGPDAPWSRGIAQYGTGRLMWWRTVSLAPRPAWTWTRGELSLADRTDLGGTDQQGRRLVLVTCRHGQDTFQLMLSAPALSGLVSWLESGPRVIGRED